MGRIFISGDCHGEHSIKKFASNNFNRNNELGLTKEDYVIITGDFGLIWDSTATSRERWWLNWLDEKPWTTLFVDGNHESHFRLDNYPVGIWNGGKVHEVSDSVIHLMRGQVFNLHGKLFFCNGGANSHDVEWRIPDRSWWAREIPSFCEREEALANLEAHNWKVDYVITHDAPTFVAQRLIHTPDRKTDEYTDWLEREIANKLEFNQWFFGHHHQDRELFNGKYQCMYHDIAQIL